MKNINGILFRRPYLRDAVDLAEIHLSEKMNAAPESDNAKSHVAVNVKQLMAANDTKFLNDSEQCPVG